MVVTGKALHCPVESPTEPDDSQSCTGSVSESDSDDSGTDSGNNDSHGSSRSSAYDATEAGGSDLDLTCEDSHKYKRCKNDDTFLYLILRKVPSIYESFVILLLRK